MSGLPRWLSGKEPPANAGGMRDVGSVSEMGRGGVGRGEIDLHMIFVCH